ncbi:MAG: SidJ-related pseudokinase [Desulfobacterium sp.]|nr:SidJ-related pseudokinase [Desulfobacterium sp.]
MNQALDFSAAYMAVKSIGAGVERCAGNVTDETVQALIFLIGSKKFDSQKQVLFLFRETADTLIAILDADPYGAGKSILPALQKILISSTGHRQRAVGEALGSLPLAIEPVKEPAPGEPLVGIRSFKWITGELDICGTAQFTWRGRSLTAPTRTNRIGVIKFLNALEDPGNLAVETGWLEFFRTHAQSDFTDFDIPRPLKDGTIGLYKIIKIPDSIVLPPALHGELIAIAFCASPNYYDYPNEPLDHGGLLDLPRVLGRNARLLGKTAAMGIVHTAVIPLFHNRVQQNRRQDGGIYQWERSGRLDRWLESCRHPNFATSGLRDFEHFAFVPGTKKLHHYIGSHLLSLVLVAGSFFRNNSPEQRGRDALGHPVDARGLFDPNVFKRAITCTINQYYSGFTGVDAPPSLLPSPSEELMRSLIDEMGVDRHMDEILRIEDQDRMDNHQFRSFLLDRGLSLDEAALHERGKANISLSTGPHLGGFNQQISVPRLIDHIFSWASLCICGKFLQEKAQSQRP